MLKTSEKSGNTTRYATDSPTPYQVYVIQINTNNNIFLKLLLYSPLGFNYSLFQMEAGKRYLKYHLIIVVKYFVN